MAARTAGSKAKAADPVIGRLKKIAFRIAIVGGLSSVIALNSIPFLLNRAIRNTPHYKQAMELLRNHPEAVKYLGEPIEGGKVNVTKPEDYGTNDEKEWYKVLVKGPKTKGHLYYEVPATKGENTTIPPKLITVELTLASLPDYKLLIKRPE